ncbi:MAG: lysophospholipid acyltransferase family protein [Pyrinomonadaceae bacterium]
MRTITAAIKIVLFIVSTLGLYWTWFILRIFIPNKVHWRQIIFAGWTKSFVSISNMRVVVVGTPPQPPFFLVTNHLSYTDIAAIRSVAKGIFVAKAEVETCFLAGRICRDMGTIFIDRANRRDIPRAGELIVERLDMGEGVVVFPEGKATKGEEVLPFNSSFLEFAAQGDIPVSYASITYTTPEGETPANQAACWWEDISFFAHLWRLFKVSEYTAVITFGEEPVVNPDRKLLAAELRQRVADSFVPVK